MRFDHGHVSDAPCLPSRTSLFSGRFGIDTGVVKHGGQRASIYNEGINRGFWDWLGEHSWPGTIRRAGLTATTISSFGDRRSAWSWYAGFSEIIKPNPLQLGGGS